MTLEITYAPRLFDTAPRMVDMDFEREDGTWGTVWEIFDYQYVNFIPSSHEVERIVLAEIDNIPADGKPHHLVYSREYEEVDNEDNELSSIMSWGHSISETVQFTIVRSRFNPNSILVTQGKRLEHKESEWGYSDNSGRDSWEASQIAEHDMKAIGAQVSA